MCVVRSRSCRWRETAAREEKGRKNAWVAQGDGRERGVRRNECCAENCIAREREGERKSGMQVQPRANHSRRSANNLLVFHVRFDSLSFRYLYLPDPLRILGIWTRERERENPHGEKCSRRTPETHRRASLLRRNSIVIDATRFTIISP